MNVGVGVGVKTETVSVGVGVAVEVGVEVMVSVDVGVPVKVAVGVAGARVAVGVALGSGAAGAKESFRLHAFALNKIKTAALKTANLTFLVAMKKSLPQNGKPDVRLLDQSEKGEGFSYFNEALPFSSKAKTARKRPR